MALQEGGEEGGGQLLGMDIGDTLYSWDGHLVDFYLLQIHIALWQSCNMGEKAIIK